MCAARRGRRNGVTDAHSCASMSNTRCPREEALGIKGPTLDSPCLLPGPLVQHPEIRWTIQRSWRLAATLIVALCTKSKRLHL